jgi:hypothetical protein
VVHSQSGDATVPVAEGVDQPDPLVDVGTESQQRHWFHRASFIKGILILSKFQV